MFFTIGKVVLAAQVIDCLLAISYNMQWAVNTGLAKGSLHEKNVIFAVFNQQKNTLCIHVGFFNSIQKRQPVGSFASIPTEPPILSTALRTMANPIPVPS